MKISPTKTQVVCLSRNPTQSMLQVSNNALLKVETFKYLGVVFTSGQRRNNRLIRGLIKQSQFCLKFIALCSQNGTFKYRKAVSF